MADGGQRLLDVIDDPNALESFLGGLTADPELLPSAETVDNVVASLARSLDDNEYEPDSPNETFFDTLDSSSNHLTDISRSYVPSDFGHHVVSVQSDPFTNNLDGLISNGANNSNSGAHEQQQQLHLQISGGGDQFIGSSANNNNNNSLINSVLNSSAGGVSSILNSNNGSTVVVSSSNLKQIVSSVNSNCDPSKTSNSNFVVHTAAPSVAGQQQQQLTQNSLVNASSNNLNFAFSSQHDLQHLKQEVSPGGVVNAVTSQQNHLHHQQVASLSSNNSVEGQQQQILIHQSSSNNNLPSNNNSNSSSTNNLISTVVGSTEGATGGVITSFSGGSSGNSFQIVSQSGQIKQQSIVIPASGSITDVSNVSGAQNVTLSTSTNVVGSAGTHIAAIQQQPLQQQQQFITNATGGLTSIPSMTVSGAQQLIANSGSGLVSAGQNTILQQIQSAAAASAGQSYIAMDQPTTALIATGATTFGGGNLALVATGGTPTYAVLPTTPQFLTNTISIPQQHHTIQTLATKTANGTTAYFQTTTGPNGTPQLVATSNVNAATLQNVVSTQQTASNSSSTVTTSPAISSVSSSTETSNNNGSTTVGGTDGVSQLLQQSQQQQTAAAGTVAIATSQQSFAIGNAASLGQIVSQVGTSLNTTMSAPQQTQLTGTIVVNQYGQPMLLPTASTAQAGLQLILRQQPTQPQVLTIQAPTAQATAQAAAATGKPVVRYVSQVPQVAQTPGYALQQMQTPNGPTWVAVRYPQASQASQFSQIQTDSIISAGSTLQNQISAAGQSQIQLQTLQQPQTQQQQLIQQQQTQQQTQVQLQSSISQGGLTTSIQQQQQQVQQLQQQLQQQQVQLKTTQQNLTNLQQTQQQQIQVQQSSIVGLLPQQNLPQQQQQQQQAQNQITMETHQQMSTPTQQQQNQFINRPSASTPQPSLVNHREAELQQISVPDSSSEPPPPKKAKSKPKSSKKKVTLDLEQLMKQTGIIDEDDDMSFDFGFGSIMDSTPNGLPPSPLLPPAQIPVINTTETPKKPASKKKSSSKKSPAASQQPPPPPVVPQPPPPIITTPSPSAKKPSSKRKTPAKKKPPAGGVASPYLPQTPPPPPPIVVQPPPPLVTTPISNTPSSKSKSGSSKKKKSVSSNNNNSNSNFINSSSSVLENQKSETTPTPTTPKTGSSRRKKDEPPKKVSSLDTLLATINAVAAAGGAPSSMAAANSPSVSFSSSLPPPPPVVFTSSQPSTPSKPEASPKPKSKSKPKSKKPTTPKSSSVIPSVTPAPPLPPSIPSQIQSVLPNSLAQHQQLSVPQPNSVGAGFMSSTPAPVAAVNQQQSNQYPVGAAAPIPNGNVAASSVNNSQSGLTRVVQTIQLTPQNQQLLRNIQGQIQRLCALPKRNETEQAALQKLVVLQQQVIATGTPVPSPAHLNNIVNVESSISLAMSPVPCSSFDTAAAASSSPASSSSTASATNLLPSSLVSPALDNTNTLLSDINLSPVSSSTVAITGGIAQTVIPPIVPPIATSANSSSFINSTNGSSIVVGSPSVSSTASPDSTSNLNNLNFEQSTNLPTNLILPNSGTSSSSNSNFLVSNDLGQLVASLSMVPSSDEKIIKENAQGKGLIMAQQQQQQILVNSGGAGSVVVPVSTSNQQQQLNNQNQLQNAVAFSQSLQNFGATSNLPLPPAPTSSYVTAPPPPPFNARAVLDEKKAEELRLQNQKAEEEKRARWKKEEFEMLLQRDQQYVVKPDYEVPFESKRDAVERLSKYHIYRDRNDMDFEEFDKEFGNNAEVLLGKFSVMLSKYRNLLLKESTKEVGCAERVMLERMFVSEEKVRMEQDRHIVKQGDVLELPPPPESWVPKIKEMVDKEMMEFEPPDPVLSQQVQSAVDSIIGCESNDTSSYMLEDGDKIEYDAFGVPINSSGYAGLTASSADIDEAVRSILT